MILKEFLQKKKQGKANGDVMISEEEESAEKPSNILGIIEKTNREEQVPQGTYWLSDTSTKDSLKKEHRKNRSCQGRVGQPYKAT